MILELNMLKYRSFLFFNWDLFLLVKGFWLLWIKNFWFMKMDRKG